MHRAFRLRRSTDFQRVRAARRSWALPLLVLYTAPNELSQPRLGVTVSRQVGKAVVRNLVRRRLREAVRLRLPLLLAGPKPGTDLVLVARPPSAQADWSALREAVDELLRRARLLAAQPGPAARA